MKGVITIDGFEFERASQFMIGRATEIEHLNYFLEKKFNDFTIKDFISRHHPELYPNHVGLRSDECGKLSVVVWQYNHSGPEGYGDRGWEFKKADNPGKYIQDILAFYQQTDKPFYNFIKDKIMQ